MHSYLPSVGGYTSMSFIVIEVTHHLDLTTATSTSVKR